MRVCDSFAGGIYGILLVKVEAPDVSEVFGAGRQASTWPEV